MNFGSRLLADHIIEFVYDVENIFLHGICSQRLQPAQKERWDQENYEPFYQLSHGQNSHRNHRRSSQQQQPRWWDTIPR